MFKLKLTVIVTVVGIATALTANQARPAIAGNATASMPVSKAPTTCTKAPTTDVGLKLYLVTPGGARRDVGTKYVRVTTLAQDVQRYGFEDQGEDFDLTDVMVDVDRRNLAKVTFTIQPVQTKFHNLVGVDIIDNGALRHEVVLWADAFNAYGHPVVLDLQTDPAYCRTILVKAQINPADCRPDQPFKKQLQTGMKGTEVARLQSVLKCLGYYPAELDITGLYGKLTKTAILDFQKAHGIPLTGIAGDRTRATLNKL